MKYKWIATRVATPTSLKNLIFLVSISLKKSNLTSFEMLMTKFNKKKGKIMTKLIKYVNFEC